MLSTTDAAAAASRLYGVRSAIRQPLERVLNGAPVSDAEALTLLEVEAPEELSAVLAVAGHVRTRVKGTVVTYSPKVFLPITNLCRDRCSYCTFRSDPNDLHAWTMLPEEIRAGARNGHTLQCTEALMCLGDKPELVFRAYRSTLQALPIISSSLTTRSSHILRTWPPA